MKSPVYVISDLHMGAADMASRERHKGNQALSRDNFEVWDHGRHLLELIDHLQSRPSASLLILGDFFELWQTGLGDVLEARRDLLDRLDHFGGGDRNRLRYVVGNHDADLKMFITSPDWIRHPFFRHLSDPFKDTLGGRSYYFLHGHEGDPFNRGTFPGSGRALAILAALLEDQVGSPYFDPPACQVGVQASLTAVGDRLLSFWNWLASGIAGRQARMGGDHRGGPELMAIPEGAANDAGGGQTMIALERFLFREAAFADPAETPVDLPPPPRAEGFDQVSAVNPDPLEGDVAWQYLMAAWNEYARQVDSRAETAGGRGDANFRGFFKKGETPPSGSPVLKPNTLLQDHLRQMRQIRQEIGQENVIVAGHTHIACRCGDWYYNSGAWTERRFGQIMVIPESGGPTLYDWKDSGLCPKNWPVVNIH